MANTTYGNDPKPFNGQQNAVDVIASFMQAEDNRTSRVVKKTGQLGADVTMGADDMQSGILEVNYALTASVTVKIPLTGGRKNVFYFLNRTSGASWTVTVKTTDAASTGVEVPRGSGQWLAVDGVNIIPLTAPQAVTATSLSTGLVGYWKLDEASGTRNDSGGTNHLTDNNTVTQAAGKVANAAQFTAANSEYLSVADSAALSTGDIDFTICAWVYLDSKSSSRLIVSKGTLATAAATEYWVDHLASTDRFRFGVSTGAALATVSADVLGAPSLATWYFVVAWHDSVGNTINISVNNGAANSAAHSAGVQDSTQPFQIGAAAGPSGFMDGRVDEVGVWKKVLTAAERTLMYNGGSGRTTPL